MTYTVHTLIAALNGRGGKSVRSMFKITLGYESGLLFYTPAPDPGQPPESQVRAGTVTFTGENVRSILMERKAPIAALRDIEDRAPGVTIK